MAKRLSISLATLLFVLGCGGSDSTSTAPASDPNAPATVDSSTFGIAGNIPGGGLIHNSLDTDFDLPCEIDPSASNEDLNCIIDANEGDLYHNGVEISFNVPRGLCYYTRVRPHWYYNQAPGYGPRDLVMNITTVGGSITASTCEIDGNALGNCNDTDEISWSVTDGTATCAYDRSDETGKENCCMGSYSMTINRDDDGDLSSSTGFGSWGTSLENCVGGPGRTNWVFKRTDGLPADIEVALREDAYSTTITIAPPIQKVNQGTNFAVAGYYTPANHLHAGISGGLSAQPFFVDPIDDYDTSPGESGIIPGNSGYQFECLNQGYEVIHRITAYVRDWDVYTDYLAYIASDGVTAVPDRGTGDFEGTDCDGVGADCNDRWDPDDFESEIGGYDLSTPTNRVNYFPEETYD